MKHQVIFGKAIIDLFGNGKPELCEMRYDICWGDRLVRPLLKPKDVRANG